MFISNSSTGRTNRNNKKLYKLITIICPNMYAKPWTVFDQESQFKNKVLPLRVHFISAEQPLKK